MLRRPSSNWRRDVITLKLYNPIKFEINLFEIRGNYVI